MLKDKKAILFDLDGTLMDSIWLWEDIDIEYLSRFGYELPPNLQKEIEGMGFTETAIYFKDRFQIPHTLEEIKEQWNAMAYEKYSQEVRLKPGAFRFLKKCRQAGMKMAIASSNSRELINACLKANRAEAFFDAIVISCDVPKGKPAPDIYLKAAEELKVRPEDCLVFEDVPMGILAGKSAGMTVCAVADEAAASQRDRIIKMADFYIRDFTEIRWPSGKKKENPFLPVSREDMENRGWKQLDFVYVIGDAYVDHPSFGHAIISRLLEAHGYRVGIIPQPDWKNPDSVKKLGRPRLGYLVTAGNMDSMVNHYSVSKKRRKTDAYTPGAEMGKRPDYAAIVYCNLIRQAYKDVPIIVGGIEASLRRLAHYDYWSDSLKRSLLMDCGANIISYGMGEHSILEIAEALDSGINISDITYIDGTCYRTKKLDTVYDYQLLPDYSEMISDRKKYAESFYVQYCNTDPFSGSRMVEPYGTVYVVQNPPAKPLTQQEMDDIYDLPYCRTWHPMYDEAGGIPAIEEVKFSLVSNRGCFGGCNFCALTFHQGRIIQTRSHESIIKEAHLMTEYEQFKGYIHDVGGPTANFRHPSCDKQLTKGVCKNRQCLFPTPCKNLKVDHKDYIELLRKLRSIPKVKKVFIRSGIRFDYLLADSSDEFFRELIRYHISGQLKVAPEHVANRVLEKMGKPEHSVYLKFTKKYEALNKSCGMNQYLVPYLMSSHPGCSMKEAVELACYLRDLGYMPEQVQDFYPTPSTISTCMYYTGLDPRTMEPVYIEKNPHKKALQRALIQYRKPENYDLIVEALTLAGRKDLIGFGPQCLIRPKKGESRRNDSSKEHQSASSHKKKTIRNVHKKR